MAADAFGRLAESRGECGTCLNRAEEIRDQNMTGIWIVPHGRCEKKTESKSCCTVAVVGRSRKWCLLGIATATVWPGTCLIRSFRDGREYIVAMLLLLRQ